MRRGFGSPLLWATLASLTGGCRSGPLPDPDPVSDTSVPDPAEVYAYLAAHYKSFPLVAEKARTRFYVPITVEGKLGRLLVDTGAVSSMFFAASLPKLGLTDLDKVGRRYSGVGGDASSGWSEFSSLIIAGKISVKPGRFGILKGRGDPDCDGVLGNDIMRRLHVVLDFRNDRLWFLDESGRLDGALSEVASKARMKTSNLREMFGVGFLSVRLSGRTYQCIVDTGCRTWMITESVAGEIGAKKTKLAADARGIGEDTVAQYAVMLPNRTVLDGGLTLEKCVVLAAEHGDGIPIYNYGGLFGVSVLADNGALMDIGNHAVYFDRQNLLTRYRYSTPEQRVIGEVE